MAGYAQKDLRIDRNFAASPVDVWRAWTDPALLSRWYAPPPMRTRVEELDVRVGGTQRLVMIDPTGQEYPLGGVFLDVVPERRLVVSDAYVSAWVPSDKPFFTVIVTIEPAGTGTHYSVVARHWSEVDRAAHEAMGFQKGWGICADQLGEVAASL